MILNTDYPGFLDYLYGCNPGLDGKRYSEQLLIRNESFFGVAGFYALHLKELGHEVTIIYANNGPMQAAWAREHGGSTPEARRGHKIVMQVIQNIRSRFSGTLINKARKVYSPLLYKLENYKTALYDILTAQIKYYKPELVLNLSMDGLSSRFFQEARGEVPFLVGQHAAPIPAGENYRCYDLVLSSLPNQVVFFQGLGVKSRFLGLGFEPSILEQLLFRRKNTWVSFVGSLSGHHRERIRLLEEISKEIDLKLWGRTDTMKKNPTLLSLIQGHAWGKEMFQILADSQVVLNHHIGISGRYANNMRLYEATGVGALLVTDWKENLDSLFEPGKEVVTYRSPPECIEVLRYYLENPSEAEAIANAGQRRTLAEYTYRRRMEELIKIFDEELF